MIRPATFLAAFAAALAAVPARAAQDGPVTVVYLVRHAEKAAQPAADPPLTPEGEARATALATLLRQAGVQDVYTTQYARTRSTAAPFVAAAGLQAIVIGATGDAPAHARTVADRILANPGRTVLVVGHSNTIPAIVEALGAPAPEPIRDDEYDDLFVVILQAGRTARVVRARYGT
jgi:broad specificity phosphatase PhoE